MNDWNGNGKYDSSDSFIDYHGTNGHSSKASSDWWVLPLIAIIFGVCAPLGFVILIGMWIWDSITK